MIEKRVRTRRKAKRGREIENDGEIVKEWRREPKTGERG